MTSDPLPADKRSLVGRSAARKEKARRDDTERSLNVVPTASGQRAMTVMEQVQIASLGLQVGRFDTDQKEINVMSLKYRAEIVEKRLQRMTARAESSGDWTVVNDLENQLDALLQQMETATSLPVTNSGVKRCRDLISQDEEEKDDVEQSQQAVET